jgi:hypothetical protein
MSRRAAGRPPAQHAEIAGLRFRRSIDTCGRAAERPICESLGTIEDISGWSIS